MAAAQSPPFTIRLADPADGEAQRCLALLALELERRAILGPVPTAPLVPGSSFLVAYLRGEAIGCGAVVNRPDAPSEIDNLWVARPARRIGIGRLLLAELELRAVVSGAPAVRARIDRALHEATILCRSTDYVELPNTNGDKPAYRLFEKPI
jgi:GNAT superfamily N-acetyltransferase